MEVSKFSLNLKINVIKAENIEIPRHLSLKLKIEETISNLTEKSPNLRYVSACNIFFRCKVSDNVFFLFTKGVLCEFPCSYVYKMT